MCPLQAQSFAQWGGTVNGVHMEPLAAQGLAQWGGVVNGVVVSAPQAQAMFGMQPALLRPS